MSRGHILIAGASGVIGSAAVERFAGVPGWDVTALSRRAPVVAPDRRYRHLPIDLLDRDECARALDAQPSVTHMLYAADSEAPGLAGGWLDPQQIEKNAAMFVNLLDPVARTGALRHVVLIQGAKAYGAHVHPVEVPLRESDPRDPHPNFYWRHEDALREAAARHGFGFTIFRPQVLMGSARGAAMNPVAAIGAYAALCHERGLPFGLPGDSEALWELVDAGLLAEAIDWAMAAPAAAGRTFNVTNGDVFVLRHHWSRIAEALGLEVGEPPAMGFADFFTLPENRVAWSAIAERHGLIEPSLAALVGQSDRYLDLLLSSRIAAKVSPVLLSTVALRQAGFGECCDSLASLLHQLRRMVELRLLPGW